MDLKNAVNNMIDQKNQELQSILKSISESTDYIRKEHNEMSKIHKECNEMAKSDGQASLKELSDLKNMLKDRWCKKSKAQKKSPNKPQK